jgi:DNA repair protein RecO (recombination protein O)
LRRTNYGEADRIVTFLTPAGKLKALVKGVRRSKSKLAGGIELFSESSVTFMDTRGDLARIVSTRLIHHYQEIVGDLQRMMAGYEFMKALDSLIEDEAESEYYELLKSVLGGLADIEIPLDAVEVWFYVRLLRLQGHGLNLKTDSTGNALEADSLYFFSPEHMCFNSSKNGQYRAEHIKLLRLCLSQSVQVLKQVKDADDLTKSLKSLVKQLSSSH